MSSAPLLASGKEEKKIRAQIVTMAALVFVGFGFHVHVLDRQECLSYANKNILLKITYRSWDRHSCLSKCRR